MVTRARIGALASRIYPNLDEVIWNRKRDKEMRAENEAAGHLALVADLPKFD